MMSDSEHKNRKRFLVTGASGQIGTAILPVLYKKYGVENIIASDVREPVKALPGLFIKVDITNYSEFEEAVVNNSVNTILHLAAILSADGEQRPLVAQKVNILGFDNSLEIARKHKCLLFAPSSIAAFGDKCPKYNVPEDAILLPNSIYGVAKVHQELLGRYYNQKFDVDFRCLRYPGIMSSEEFESHGTTDYSTEIFFKALKDKRYVVYLKEDTALPMIHIDDAIEATLQFIETDNKCLTRRVYNLAGLSFTPKQLATEVKKIIPEFEVEYIPDFRQEIADSWPSSLVDETNVDWGWKFTMTVPQLVHKMFSDISKQKDKQLSAVSRIKRLQKEIKGAEVSIERMSEEDVEDVMKIQKASCHFNEFHDSESTFMKVLEFFPEGCACLLVNGKKVGFIMCYPVIRGAEHLHKSRDNLSLTGKEDCLFIHEISIHPLFQRRGLIKPLFNYFNNLTNKLALKFQSLVAIPNFIEGTQEGQLIYHQTASFWNKVKGFKYKKYFPYKGMPTYYMEKKLNS